MRREGCRLSASWLVAGRLRGVRLIDSVLTRERSACAYIASAGPTFAFRALAARLSESLSALSIRLRPASDVSVANKYNITYSAVRSNKVLFTDAADPLVVVPRFGGDRVLRGSGKRVAQECT